MRRLGIRGAVRGRRFVRTTVTDDAAVRPADLVERDFRAVAPNQLWGVGLTDVKTHTGWAYVAFIVDVYSSRIVGWQASRSLRADLAIDALEMAVHNRGRTDDLSNPSLRQGRALSVCSRLGTARGERHHRIRRMTRRLLRQRARRIVQRPVQVGNHPPARTMAVPQRRRVRHPGIRRLVQPPTSPRTDHRRSRLHHPRRARERPLP